MKVYEALAHEIKKQKMVDALMSKKRELTTQLAEVKSQLRKLIQR